MDSSKAPPSVPRLGVTAQSHHKDRRTRIIQFVLDQHLHSYDVRACRRNAHSYHVDSSPPNSWAVLTLSKIYLLYYQTVRGFSQGLNWLRQIGLFVLLRLFAASDQLSSQIVPTITIGLVLFYHYVADVGVGEYAVIRLLLV